MAKTKKTNQNNFDIQGVASGVSRAIDGFFGRGKQRDLDADLIRAVVGLEKSIRDNTDKMLVLTGRIVELSEEITDLRDIIEDGFFEDDDEDD